MAWPFFAAAFTVTLAPAEMAWTDAPPADPVTLIGRRVVRYWRGSVFEGMVMSFRVVPLGPRWRFVARARGSHVATIIEECAWGELRGVLLPEEAE
jgi:hypothetical protein